MKEETFQHESVILFSRRWNVGSNDGVTLHKTFREVASSSTSSCYVRRVGATGRWRTRTPDGWGASGGGGYVFLHNTAAARGTSASALPRSIAHLGKRPNPSDPGVRQTAGPYFQCTTWSVQLARRQRRRPQTRAERKFDCSLGPSLELTKARKVFKMECHSLCDMSAISCIPLSREEMENERNPRSENAALLTDGNREYAACLHCYCSL